MAAYTFFEYLSPDPDIQKFALGVGVGLALVGVSAALTAPLRRATTLGGFVVPEERATTRGVFELVVEKFVSFHDSIVGREGRRFVPFTGSLFLFILISNLIGLVPGFPALTTTVWVNVGLALATFLYFNYQGIVAHGFGSYIKHFAGPIWWLAWLIFPIEILSTCLRVLTLNLRLYWNITADHIVLGIFTDLVPYVLPVFFLLVGTFVSFMQAFIFTTLTLVYLQLATAHEEGENHHDH